MLQSEKVTTVLEALKEMTVKEPIQGYTCAKTKQEVNFVFFSGKCFKKYIKNFLNNCQLFQFF